MSLESSRSLHKDWTYYVFSNASIIRDGIRGEVRSKCLCSLRNKIRFCQQEEGKRWKYQIPLQSIIIQKNLLTSSSAFPYFCETKIPYHVSPGEDGVGSGWPQDIVYIRQYLSPVSHVLHPAFISFPHLY
jgi:hypothetical protein